ncbi:MAG: hypothetical protein RR807_03890 [Oscillospiraceae bacterium]
MTEQIFETAKVVGSVAAEDFPALRVCCEAAEGELSASLKEGVAASAAAPAFNTAAAFLALAAFWETRTEATHFTAGDLSVTAPAPNSGGLRRQAKRMMAPFLRDENFAFSGVMG